VFDPTLLEVAEGGENGGNGAAHGYVNVPDGLGYENVGPQFFVPERSDEEEEDYLMIFSDEQPG
jgi:hypothetical protein